MWILDLPRRLDKTSRHWQTNHRRRNEDGHPALHESGQARGEDVDHRSDLYSVCVILFEALSGQKPVDEETGNGSLVNFLHRVATVPPKNLDIVAQVSPPLSQRL